MKKKTVMYYAAFRGETVVSAINAYQSKGRKSLKAALKDTERLDLNKGGRMPGSFVYKVTVERIAAKQETKP